MVVRTRLITIDSRVLSPEGVVFSTDPRRAEAENEVSYFIKGPDLETVFAEISGSMLAREVGLPVPDVAACEFDDGMYAGSAKVDDAVRDIEPWLGRPQRVGNFEEIFSTLVVDIWLANKDRNIGNVLGKPISHGKIQFVFIDFEKSRALRPAPTVSSTMLQPRELWPSGTLGRELRAKRAMYPPREAIQKIHSLPAARCAQIIHESAAAIGAPVAWEDDSVHALSKRAERIQELAEEVWRS